MFINNFKKDEIKESDENSKFKTPISENAKDYPIIKLNSGYEMPVIKIGTYSKFIR